MKKEYIIPIVRTVLIQKRQPVLAGSFYDQIPVSEEGEADAKHASYFFDDEEEDVGYSW